MYIYNGNVTSVTYDTGVTAKYEYNYANLVTSVTNKKDGNVLSSYSYTYGFDGNQLSKTDHTGKTDTYTYDNLGRLKTENNVTYDYDYAFQ